MAREQGLNIIGVKESDPRFGAPDMALERSRAMTGGPGGGPVNDKAAENVELLDQVCFIVSGPVDAVWLAGRRLTDSHSTSQDRQTQQHLLPGYLDEIIQQGIADVRAREHQDAEVDVSVDGVEPEPEPALAP